MPKAIYIYSPLTVKELEALVAAHQEEFDAYLEETFTEDELGQFERKLDSIGAIWPQPILSELTFDDLSADPEREEVQRSFFEVCRSSLLLENLPDFETNPFQVTYLVQLLGKFKEVLIDEGEQLAFKEDFLNELRQYKSIDSIISSTMEKVVGPAVQRAATPIDFLIHDIYKELDRIGDGEIYIEADKARKIYEAMRKGKIDAHSLLKKTGLNPKDFDDNLEKLKFILKKV